MQLNTERADCWKHISNDGVPDGNSPPNNLAKLREKNASDILNWIKIILPQGEQITNPEGLENGRSHFRASIPISNIFVQLHFDALRQLLGDKCWFRFFALPRENIQPWKGGVFINYLAIAYNAEDIRKEPPQPLFRINNHLKSIGGKLFIVIKQSQAWEWKSIGCDDNGGNAYVKMEDKYWPENSTNVTTNEYKLLFNSQCTAYNTIILLTFSGYYMPEGN